MIGLMTCHVWNDDLKGLVCTFRVTSLWREYIKVGIKFSTADALMFGLHEPHDRALATRLSRI